MAAEVNCGGRLGIEPLSLSLTYSRSRHRPRLCARLKVHSLWPDRHRAEGADCFSFSFWPRDGRMAEREREAASAAVATHTHTHSHKACNNGDKGRRFTLRAADSQRALLQERWAGICKVSRKLVVLATRPNCSPLARSFKGGWLVYLPPDGLHGGGGGDSSCTNHARLSPLSPHQSCRERESERTAVEAAACDGGFGFGLRC